MSLKNLKIAIVCDWLTNFGGAERVILALHQLFPGAPIYTAIYNSEKMPGFENADIRTSYLQHFPFAKKKHQLYLPLYPHVFESFDLGEYDIVISSSHSCAKGIITKPQTLHICYCHSPMRYAWDGSHSYVQGYKMNNFLKRLGGHFLHKIRIWDRLSAERVDSFIANSHFVQKRIAKYYRKPSSVIHPFVDTKRFTIGTDRESFYLAVGRLTSYKRFDLIVDAFNKLCLPLKIVGTGIAMEELKEKAKPNIQFSGNIPDSELSLLYRKAKALIFPQVEDFGITPLEAMASGCPVIAYDKGGALETVNDGKSGMFFHEQTDTAIMKAVREFEQKKFKPETIREQAEKFDISIFNKKILEFIEHKWQHWNQEMT